MKWFKHAFAVDPPGAAEPTPEQAEVVEWLCKQIVKRHLTTPALAALEMSRPLNYIGSQTLHFFQPFVSAIQSKHGHEGYCQFATYLEKRGSIEYICHRIEELEDECEQNARQASGESDSPNEEHPVKEEQNEKD